MENPSNPFQVAMTSLWIPRHMAQMVSVAGFDVSADKDGRIEVPREHVEALVAHGLSRTPPDGVADPKRK